MTQAPETERVTAMALVDALANERGSMIEIERNGGSSPVIGTMIRAFLTSEEVDERELPVVHVLMHRKTRDGTTPVMVSLVTGVYPDEDFFWPECRIEVIHETGRQRFSLRSAP